MSAGNVGIPVVDDNNNNNNNNDNNNNNNNNNNYNVTTDGNNNNNAAKTNLIEINVIPSTRYVLPGVANTIDVLFQITTGKKEEKHIRPPCDVSIVLDRSGSMAGLKLENSKKAICQMAEALSPGDLLHFVVYDDNAEVIFEKYDPIANKDDLLTKVNDVKDKGCTNLYEGMEIGGKTLEKYRQKGHLERLFLFSDGLANRGKQEKGEIWGLASSLHQQGITVSSYGIGSDFDEDMMKGIQEHGTGDYYFIENETVIEKLVSLGLRGLLSLIGTETVLKIRGKNGGIVKKVFSYEDIVKGAVIGDLKEDNIVQILARVEIAPQENPEVVAWDFSYLPSGSQESVSITGSLTVEFTENEALLNDKHPQVQVTLVTQEVAESYREVIKAVERGDFKQAIALQTASIENLKAVLHLDNSGVVEKMIKSKEKGVEILKTKNVRVARKKMHKEAYEDARCEKWAYAEHD